MAKKQEINRLQELKTAIKEKSPARLYFFHGEEVFLLNHYLGQLKKILIDELTESFNFHRLNNETFDMQSLVDAVENLPMMAETTMVRVDDIDIFKLNEDERNKLTQIFADIPDYCTLVFTYETLDFKPDKRLKKLWDAIERCGVIVEFEKQNQRDLIAWVTRHFMAAGKRISADLCAYLIDITDGTMTSLSGEIKKICAYSGADTVCRADIDAVTEPVIDAVVYQMSDFLGQGSYAQALDKLHQLLKMQEEPVSLLGVIGGHFRRLSAARTLMDNGKNISELMNLTGMREYPARKAMDSARRFKPAFYRRASELVLQTDYRMKTSFDKSERLLEMLILQLAQEAKNG